MTMIKYGILLLLLFGGLQVQAQEAGTHETHIAIGAVSSNDILDITNNIVVSALTIGEVSYRQEAESPSVSLTYKYTLRPQLQLFADATFQRIDERILINGTPDDKIENTFYTIGVGASYQYLTARWFQMYGSTSLGLTIHHSQYDGNMDGFEDGTDSYMNFQVSPVGLRFGYDFAGFIELGFGYKGLINSGFAFRF
ncbi:hypothetical protein [Persicobacter psychrovividus]|uniref:Outer membrane protein beta-barrel domain-containing protein n=1 Tax=Persicobacter psychrovividus TaxID=387638 RepID=A0ABM7VI91_9BACT|nr:hypothetical protein PEPS_29760 [Persicobacter psychrovividus]